MYKAKPIKSARSAADKLREESFFASPREHTNYLLEMLDDGIVDGDSLARELLQYLSDDEVGEFIRIYDYERPEDIETASCITSSHYVNVGTLSIGDCIQDDEDDECHTITDISKRPGGVYKFAFSDGSTAYYDSNDQVLVED